MEIFPGKQEAPEKQRFFYLLKRQKYHQKTIKLLNYFSPKGSVISL